MGPTCVQVCDEEAGQQGDAEHGGHVDQQAEVARVPRAQHKARGASDLHVAPALALEDQQRPHKPDGRHHGRIHGPNPDEGLVVAHVDDVVAEVELDGRVLHVQHPPIHKAHKQQPVGAVGTREPYVAQQQPVHLLAQHLLPAPVAVDQIDGQHHGPNVCGLDHKHPDGGQLDLALRVAVLLKGAQVPQHRGDYQVEGPHTQRRPCCRQLVATVLVSCQLQHVDGIAAAAQQGHTEQVDHGPHHIRAGACDANGLQHIPQPLLEGLRVVALQQGHTLLLAEAKVPRAQQACGHGVELAPPLGGPFRLLPDLGQHAQQDDGKPGYGHEGNGGDVHGGHGVRAHHLVVALVEHECAPKIALAGQHVHQPHGPVVLALAQLELGHHHKAHPQQRAPHVKHKHPAAEAEELPNAAPQLAFDLLDTGPQPSKALPLVASCVMVLSLLLGLPAGLCKVLHVCWGHPILLPGLLAQHGVDPLGPANKFRLQVRHKQPVSPVPVGRIERGI
eukprot:comp22621_c0_seq1/m.34756 comp22621_c0_seq1/g.34756  ORF comp22621_c0_seq1/g.34756 comp22621_c0_seq1/m.34756 type:complete len:503 (+) comp22621_c0_seq1:575-2083(+)